MQLKSYLNASWAVRKGPEKKTSIRRGMGFLPQTQVLKDLFNDVRPVKKADDAQVSQSRRW